MTSSEAQSPIEISRSASGEKRLTELGIALPPPPEPFGIYVDAVQRGNLLCLTGMFQTRGREAKFIGRAGAELDVHAGSEAALLVALNAIAVARKHLRSLDKVTTDRPGRRVVGHFRSVCAQAKVADAASELFQEIFGKNRNLAVLCTESQAFHLAL
jgi:hypothetical protein